MLAVMNASVPTSTVAAGVFSGARRNRQHAHAAATM
jgi:hypothetical protein